MALLPHKMETNVCFRGIMVVLLMSLGRFKLCHEEIDSKYPCSLLWCRFGPDIYSIINEEWMKLKCYFTTVCFKQARTFRCSDSQTAYLCERVILMKENFWSFIQHFVREWVGTAF